MEEKRCYKCERDLPVSCFKTNKKRKDGLHAQCIECQSEYRRQHYLKNRQKYIDKAKRITEEIVAWWKDYKATLSCVECGESHPACIDFHHERDDKEANVSGLIRKASKERILAEIAKCEVLCSNCHRKRHWCNGSIRPFQGFGAGSNPA